MLFESGKKDVYEKKVELDGTNSWSAALNAGYCDDAAPRLHESSFYLS